MHGKEAPCAQDSGPAEVDELIPMTRILFSNVIGNDHRRNVRMILPKQEGSREKREEYYEAYYLRLIKRVKDSR